MATMQRIDALEHKITRAIHHHQSLLENTKRDDLTLALIASLMCAYAGKLVLAEEECS
jgi:hypothetical protein